MNIKNNQYKVAGHLFELNAAAYPFIIDRMQESYAPFAAENADQNALFSVKVVDEIVSDDVIRTVFSEKRHSLEESATNVLSTLDGWIFEQLQPFSSFINGRIRISADFKQAEICLRGTEQQCWFAFNGAVMLCYILATTHLDTILTHSSCVMKEGRAYLFLGKSGTGKSTHSSLWLEHIAGTTLLNDDHPIIRVSPQGEVIAYGSPWSGKTACYKNLSAPIGGIVRIKRAQNNSIAKLNAIQAYASLTTSFSGMTWETDMADSRHATIEKVIENVPCYTLSCLPDEEAAHVCCSVVTNQPKAE